MPVHNVPFVMPHPSFSLNHCCVSTPFQASLLGFWHQLEARELEYSDWQHQVIVRRCAA